MTHRLILIFVLLSAGASGSARWASASVDVRRASIHSPNGEFRLELLGSSRPSHTWVSAALLSSSGDTLWSSRKFWGDEDMSAFCVSDSGTVASIALVRRESSHSRLALNGRLDVGIRTLAGDRRSWNFDFPMHLDERGNYGHWWSILKAHAIGEDNAFYVAIYSPQDHKNYLYGVTFHRQHHWRATLEWEPTSISVANDTILVTGEPIDGDTRRAAFDRNGLPLVRH